jgi:hypothetical protein
MWLSSMRSEHMNGVSARCGTKSITRRWNSNGWRIPKCDTLRPWGKLSSQHSFPTSGRGSRAEAGGNTGTGTLGGGSGRPYHGRARHQGLEHDVRPPARWARLAHAGVGIGIEQRRAGVVCLPSNLLCLVL